MTTVAEYLNNINAAVAGHQITPDELADLVLVGPRMCARHNQPCAVGALLNGKAVCPICMAEYNASHFCGWHGNAATLHLLVRSEAGRAMFLAYQAMQQAGRGLVQHGHALYWRHQARLAAACEKAHDV